MNRVVSTICSGFLALMLILGLSLPTGGVQAEGEPVITVFYGDTQTFGNVGNPQGQIAILGNASGATSATYTLNGGVSQPLTLGPDTRRLVNTGDFAVELFDGELNTSASGNTIVITAIGATPDLITTHTVTVYYSNHKSWPLPYTISTWTSAQGQAQIIDGQWNISGGKLVSGDIGYDRMVGIGDMSWEDYDVRAEVTPNSIDAACGTGPDYHCSDTSYGPAVGIILRWTGHTDSPPAVAGTQPKSGWLPLGAIGWYRWNYDGDGTGGRGIYHDGDNSSYAGNSAMTPGSTYVIRFQVQTVAGSPEYRLKIWSKASNEPTNWDHTWTGSADDPRSGSAVLFAHHVDVDWGPISITPLTSGAPYADIVADDFNDCTLDSSVWALTTPVNVSQTTAATSGAYTGNALLNISIPGGLADDHNPYENHNNAARVRQEIAADGDFAVEAKFTSVLGSDIQMQGIMLEEADSANFMRLEFYSYDGGIYFYARSFFGDDSYTYADYKATDTSTTGPLYMQVYRTGDEWHIWYKIGTGSWVSAARFPLLFQTKYIGLYAGNATSPTAPNTTVSVDYFWDLNVDEALLVDDTASNAISFTINGNGEVNPLPVSSNYACSAVVQLTAVPDPGWSFTGWSGDLSGSTNPTSVTMTGPKNVTATFTENSYTVSAVVSPAGAGTVNVPAGPFTYNDPVSLTATANSGWTFSGWTGDIVSSINPLEFLVTKNYSLTANFIQNPYYITISGVSGGNIQLTPMKAAYTYGESVTVTAIPSSGWRFVNWVGDLTGTENPKVITIHDDMTISAVFVNDNEYIYLPMLFK